MELGMIGLGRMGTKMAHRQAAPHGGGALRLARRSCFPDRVLSALRYEFGGHEEKADAKKGGA